jgi:hypothetical protein
MKYTQAEREKIHANLDAIKSYIEEKIQPCITSKITVDFGEIKRYVDYSREKEFHIYVYPDDIRGRIGGLGISFKRNPEGLYAYEPTAYERLDFAVGLIEEWQNIKHQLVIAVNHEQNTRQIINDFAV